MKILLIGCVQSSYAFLEALIEERTEVVGVITKNESKFNSDYAELAPLCKKYKIPYYFVKNVNDEDSIAFIKEHRADIGYCLGWSQLVSKEVIGMFPRGMIGYHPAELPNNRGRHPIIWALTMGLKRTASSFFRIVEDADAGDILSQECVEITYNDDANSLMSKLLVIGRAQIVELTRKLEQGSVLPICVNDGSGNAWRKRTKEDGRVDWRMSSYAIYNLVRALTKPYPGAHFIFEDREIKVWKVSERNDFEHRFDNIEPGKVLSVSEEGILVKAGEGLILIEEYDDVLIRENDYL